MTLADMLRLALGALAAKYRDELFPQDAENLNSAETAWVLDIPVIAVQSRLR